MLGVWLDRGLRVFFKVFFLNISTGGTLCKNLRSALSTGMNCFLMMSDAPDDIELNVLGCRVDILETNCDQCCFTSTETIRLIRTLTQLLNSDRCS